MKILNEFKKRSLFPQTGSFGYDLTFSVNNTTGYANFGFSGETNDILSFSLQSGKILDSDGNFVYGFSRNEVVSISGRCEPNVHNYYINNVPTNLNAQKPNDYSRWFYASANNCEVDLDLYIEGEKPKINISSIDFNDNNYSGNIELTNNNTLQPIKIFSGYFLTGGLFFSGFPYEDISGTENLIVLNTDSRNILSSGFSISGRFVLYTNYGTEEYNTVINSNKTVQTSLELQGDSYIKGTGTLEINLLYEVLHGNIQSNNAKNLRIDLFHVSGFGDIASGRITGVAETDNDKNITVSGVLNVSGQMTGDFAINATGWDVLLNEMAYGTATGTKVTEILFVTGSFNERVRAPFTGIGSGIFLSGIVGSGLISIPALGSGTINGSGNLYSKYHLLSGSGILQDSLNVYGEIPSGELSVFSYFTGNLTGQVFKMFTGYASGTTYSPIGVSAIGSGYFEGPVTGTTSLTGLATGFGTGFWGLSGSGTSLALINKFVGYVTDSANLITGLTGFATKNTTFIATGLHTGARIPLVGFIWQNKDGITGGIYESGLDFISPIMSLEPYEHTFTGSGFFEGFFTKATTAYSDVYHIFLTGIYRTGVYSGFSGFWTGYWEETFSGFGLGSITGNDYTGLSVAWFSGITTGQFYNGLESNTGAITWTSDPINYIRLTGKENNRLGSSGNPFIISGNTGVILASNYLSPKITGLAPPSMNISFRDHPVWFEYECPGGGTNASVTFGISNYVRFRDNGKPLEIGQGQRSPGHAIHVYKTGSLGQLIYERNGTTTSEGATTTSYATSSLKSGEKIYCLFSVYNLHSGDDGIFLMTWKDGWRGTSRSSSYLFDNPINEKTIEYIEPHEEGFDIVDNFKNYNYNSSYPTGHLDSFLVKHASLNLGVYREDVAFDFVSGKFDYIHPYVTGRVSVAVSGNVFNLNGETSYSSFYREFGQFSNYKASSPLSLSGRQTFSATYATTIDDEPYFKLELQTGNVLMSLGQSTSIRRLGRTLKNGVDYYDLQTFVNVANTEWNKFNIFFAARENGLVVESTGFFPAWSSRLAYEAGNSSSYYTVATYDDVIDIEEDFPMQANYLSGIVNTTLQATGYFTGIASNISFANSLATGATGFIYVTGEMPIYYDRNIEDGSGYFILSYTGETGTYPDTFSGFFPYQSGFYVPISNFSGWGDIKVIPSGYIEREISGLATGFIKDPTGYIKFTGYLETEPKNFNIQDGSGYFLFTGFLSGLASGLSLFSTGDNFIYGTGVYSRSGNYLYYPDPFLFSRTYSGDITGYFYNENYSKTFTGEWGFRTGDLANLNLVDFSEGLYFPDFTGFSNYTQNYVISGSSGISIYIDRKRNINSDLALLVISGDDKVINFLITGGAITTG